MHSGAIIKVCEKTPGAESWAGNLQGEPELESFTAPFPSVSVCVTRRAPRAPGVFEPVKRHRAGGSRDTHGTHTGHAGAQG